jgi:hypothetical protein
MASSNHTSVPRRCVTPESDGEPVDQLQPPSAARSVRVPQPDVAVMPAVRHLDTDPTVACARGDTQRCAGGRVGVSNAVGGQFGNEQSVVIEQPRAAAATEPAGHERPRDPRSRRSARQRRLAELDAAVGGRMDATSSSLELPRAPVH